MTTSTNELIQMKALVRQIAERKAQEYMAELLTELMDLSNETGSPTVKRRRNTARKTTRTTQTPTATTDTTAGANRILRFVKSKPEGIRGLELKPLVDLDAYTYGKAMRMLKAEGKIRQKGEKREAVYFPK